MEYEQEILPSKLDVVYVRKPELPEEASSWSNKVAAEREAPRPRCQGPRDCHRRKEGSWSSDITAIIIPRCHLPTQPVFCSDPHDRLRRLRASCQSTGLTHAVRVPRQPISEVACRPVDTSAARDDAGLVPSCCLHNPHSRMCAVLSTAISKTG